MWGDSHESSGQQEKFALKDESRHSAGMISAVKTKESEVMPTYKSGQSNGGSVLPEGDYHFTVEKAILKTSKNQNEMIELWLRLPDGGLAIDNLVFTESSGWKIDQFRTSIGETVLPDEMVEIKASELVEAEGYAHIIVEEWEGKKKNKVGSYLEPDNIQLK